MAIETAGETLSVHGRFAAKIAATEIETQSAMRLRFEVFNKELREGLQESYLTGIDRDKYDEHCTHLIVCDRSSGMVVGTYRLMFGSVAQRTVGYYSETEFDLSAIKRLPGEKLELGRSCVHKDYRNSAVLGLLWKGIAAFVEKNRVIHLFGCASLHTHDPVEVGMIYEYLNLFHRAEAHYNVPPLNRLDGLCTLPLFEKEMVFSLLPPLMKGYLRLGAQICGEPSYDPVFGTTDFFILLDTQKLLGRYRRKFFSEHREPACLT